MGKELQLKARKVYQPRRVQRTTLYQVLQIHFEAWLVQAHAIDAVPKHVERDYRRYLECGILAYGFARVKCQSCEHDFLLAFSCKGQGICPSCNTKHMAATAMQLVENVLPNVPVRQFVLSLPKRLRYYLQRDTSLTNSVLKILLRVIEKHLRRCSPSAPDNARFGGITFIQRFGSSLNAHLHFHCCIIDGVFSVTEEGIQFHEALDFTETVVHEMEETVGKRVLSLFKRRSLLSEDDVNDMLSWENSGY